MTKNLSASKYYQENKERIPKKKIEKKRKTKTKCHERYLNLSKNEQKSNNMVMNVTKISKKMKNKSLLIIEKKYYQMRKNALF